MKTTTGNSRGERDREKVQSFHFGCLFSYYFYSLLFSQGYFILYTMNHLNIHAHTVEKKNGFLFDFNFMMTYFKMG